MCYIGCSAVSVSQELVIAVDAPAPRKKSLKIKRVFAKVVEAFKLRSKKAKGKPEVSDFNVSSFSSIVSAPLEDAPVAEVVKVQHEEPSCAPTLVVSSIEEESVNICEEAKDVVTSPGTIATPVLLYQTAAKISRSVKTPSLIPVRKTVVHAKGELEVKGAYVVGSNVFKVKKASNIGTVISPKEKKTDVSAVVPVAVRTSINVSKHTSIPIPAKAIPIQSRNTCRVRVRARGPAYVHKAKAGTVGDKREPLKIRSNIPVPTRHTKVRSLREKENKQDGKEKPKNAESYTIIKQETVNGPLEVISTDISKEIREKADEEVINNDPLTVASLGVPDIISLTPCTAHGIPDTTQQTTELKNDNVIPTTISGLPSIPSLPSINNLICMYTSSSLGGEHITDIKITISALPTIDSLYECEKKPSFTQAQLRPENDSAILNAERTKNVQDFDNASVLAEIPPEASQRIDESTLHNSNSVACETVHHNVVPVSISSEIRAHSTTYPITLTGTHDLHGTIAESDPHRIVESIDLVHPAIPQPPAVLSTIAAASQCAGTQARLSMTVDVMNKDQVLQFSVPTVSPSTVSLDDRSTPCTINRNDEHPELLSTMDQCVQNMQHAIETPARSASQALVQMDDQENGSPLCLHGDVEFLEKERQAQTYVCNVSPTAAESAPAAPTFNLPTPTCSATSTQTHNAADDKELAIQLPRDLARQAQARALTLKNKLDAMNAEERERRIAALTTRHEPNSSASPAKAPPCTSRIPILKRAPVSGEGLTQLDNNTTASEVSRAKQRYLDYRARKLYERQIGSTELKTNSTPTVLENASDRNARGQIYRPPLRPVTSSTLNVIEQTKKSAVDPSKSTTVAHRIRYEMA